MNKEILLFLKHPYAAGIIAVIWIGSSLLIAIQPNLPITNIIIINMTASLIIAVMGFSTKTKK